MQEQAYKPHGMIGLRPLPRDKRDHKANHGGSWAGTPTYAEQEGNYPFVAEHVDVVKGWLEGDFKTQRMFFEYYWGLSEARDVLEPQKNLLIKTIRKWESKGAEIEHILICREYRIAIQRGHKDAKPGPFREDTRILYEEDVDNIRQLFKNAYEKGFLHMNEFSSLAEEWNTWNVRSVLSHVLMPESFAVSLGIKSYHSGHCLREALIGRDEVVPELAERMINEHFFNSDEFRWCRLSAQPPANCSHPAGMHRLSVACLMMSRVPVVSPIGATTG